MPETLLVVSDAWRETFPGATVGVITMANVANPGRSPALDEVKERLERELRSRFAEAPTEQLRSVEPLPAYAAYYRRFGQRYHVGMQLESVVRKGKSLPKIAALVEAMFAAELESLLLTAGHDLDALYLPVTLDVGTGEEAFLGPRGQAMRVKDGDMYLRDRGGVLSAIITGPSDRARIGPETRNVFFNCYAPAGIDGSQVIAHLDQIAANVVLVAPEASVNGRAMVTA